MMVQKERLRITQAVGLSLLFVLVVLTFPGEEEAFSQSSPHLGFGVNPTNPAHAGIGQMGFDWTKSFHTGGCTGYRNLVRIDVHADTLNDLAGWGANLYNLALANAGCVEAWEIGNEPNIDASFAWNGPPNAADYTRVLCEAYRRIKAADPSAIVVSAGLAPVGRIPFTWNGHKGYCAPGVSWCSGYYQDEREFTREMLQAGAATCFDAFGYHPYGYAAPYDAPPIEDDPTSPCGANDFCFRGVEKIREILYEEFGVDEPIWATEFGWIVDPRQVGRSECWDDPSMQQFQWMVVSPEEQATNLVGAFQWAEEHYPWMGAMFVFNYGFYSDTSCDQKGFFDIKGRPAEQALTAMAKNIVPSRPTWSGPGFSLVEEGQTRPAHGSARLHNLSPENLDWSAAVLSSPFPITLTVASGSDRTPLALEADPRGLGLGIYTATLQVTISNDVQNVSVEPPSQTLYYAIRVVEEVFDLYLPLTNRSYSP